MRCPSCFAHVSPGESICDACGTELVIPESTVPEPSWLIANEDATESREKEDVRTECEDCGEWVTPDDNQRCPVCGSRMDKSVEELLFDQRLQEAMVESGVRRSDEPGPKTSDSGPAVAVEPEVRSEARGTHLEQIRLEVENPQTVRFEGRMVTHVLLDMDELWVGRADPAEAWLPDIDLTHLRATDPHISRRHVRFLRAADGWYVEDHAKNEATWLHDRAHLLQGERARLVSGDRVLISDTLVLRFVDPDRDD